MQYSYPPCVSPLMCSRNILICLSLCILFITIATEAAVKLPPNVTVTAVIGFGDSIIDPGNNNNIKTIVKCNFPPYGIDFMGGIPSGRFSNNRIPTDLLADELSIKKYVPAYLDPSLKPQDLLTGVSFASGASGYDPLTSKIASVVPLSTQLEQFKEYIGKLNKLVGEERTQFILKNAVVLVVAGSDDIANTYFDTPFRKKEYDPNSYTDLMLNSASSFVQEIYKLGARRIGVFGAPPIGCVPSQRTIGGGLMRECATDYNQVSQLFNSKLSNELDSLQHKLPSSSLVYINIYDPLLDLILHGDRYGFEETEKGCCGTGVLEVSVLCNKFDPVCADPSKYLFWDSYHPTDKGYQALLNILVPKYLNRLVVN